VGCLHRDDSDLEVQTHSKLVENIRKLTLNVGQSSSKRNNIKKALAKIQALNEAKEDSEEERTPFSESSLALLEGQGISSSPTKSLLDLAVFVVFLVEFLLHLALHVHVHGFRGFVPFFCKIFNLLDLASLLLFVVPTLITGQGSYQYIKILRAFKTDRFLSLVEAGTYLSLPEDVRVWVEPERYCKTSDSTIATLVKIVQILCSVQ
ncbi:hypothetical protein B484DRAFT_405033, partial [Ochromonadaceae sp. CCMP2298]